MATKPNVKDTLEPACRDTTELNTALTDKLPQPLHYSRHYISRSTDCLCSARDTDKRIIPPTRGNSVRYEPVPDIKLHDCTLRVPSPFQSKSCQGQSLSQWKSDPHIPTAMTDTLEQWEIELIAKSVNSHHCYLHLFLKVNPAIWDDIKLKYSKFSERMLQLLLAWQQQNGGKADRQELVTALNCGHLNELADQVKEKNYTKSHSKHAPLQQVKSNVYPITSSGSDQPYSYQGEKRRGSAPVLQRQMTQNTLRSLLQLKRGSTINE